MCARFFACVSSSSFFSFSFLSIVVSLLLWQYSLVFLLRMWSKKENTQKSACLQCNFTTWIMSVWKMCTIACFSWTFEEFKLLHHWTWSTDCANCSGILSNIFRCKSDQWLIYYHESSWSWKKVFLLALTNLNWIWKFKEKLRGFISRKCCADLNNT